MHRSLRTIGLLGVLAAQLPAWLHSAEVTGWRAAEPGWKYEFPRDHGPHRGFKTEWWYYVGHLKAASGEAFGYQLTFFRAALRKPDPQVRSAWSLNTVYFAHLALTDPARRAFVFRDKAGRGALGLSGANPIGRPVTTTPESAPVHETLQQVNSVTVFVLPVRAEPARQ